MDSLPPKPSLSTDVQIVGMEEKYFGQVAVFLSTSFGHPPEAIWRQLFQMWWIENPIAKNGGCAMGNVLLAGGEVVGFIGLVPVKYLVFEKAGISYAFTSWYVEEAYRRYSLMLLGQSLDPTTGDIIFNTTATEKIHVILKKFSMQELELPNVQTGIFISNVGIFVKDYLQTFKSRWNNKAIRFFILHGINRVLPLAMLVQNLRLRFKTENPDFSFRITDQCGEEYDALWAAERNAYQRTLFRDAETLNWLLFSHVLKENRILIGCYEKEKLRGYVVLNKLKQGYDLVDLFVADAVCAGFYSALAKFLGSYVRLQKLNHLSLRSTNEPTYKLASELCLFRINASQYDYFYKILNHQDDGTELVKTDRSLYASLLDGDRGLIYQLIGP